MPTVRRATREDIAAFTGGQSHPTLLAWCMENDDGEIIALGGLALIRGRYIGFCDLTEEARQYKYHIARTAIRVFDDARKQGIRFIYADRDQDEPRALEWINRLGFTLDPRSQFLYRWSSR